MQADSGFELTAACGGNRKGGFRRGQPVSGRCSVVRDGYHTPMASISSLPLATLGLGGDGDEIAAITEVEQQFGVRLDYSIAREWRTAGDVFSALQNALTSEPPDTEAMWRKFAEAISRETGVDPGRVAASTLLLGKPFPYWRLWLIGAVVGLVVAAYKALA